MADENETKFAVIADSKEHPSSLLMHDLSFGRLIDDIVLPYQTNVPFFIDGAPVKADK
jgi:hypothetical protein